MSDVPEGDSIHRLAVQFRPLVGERLAAASPHPAGRATGVAAVVDGLVLEAARAAGKHLLLEFEGRRTIRSHLRMSGRWCIQPAATSCSGTPWLVLSGETLQAVLWRGPVLTLETRTVSLLGPDLLAEECDIDALTRRVAGCGARPLADVLLDQRVVAGIGTFWLAETLWHARIHPWHCAGEITREQIAEALSWARLHMRGAITGRRPRGAAYGRAGRPCPSCGQGILVQRVGDNNRVVYWCPKCQHGPGPSGRLAGTRRRGAGHRGSIP